LLETIPHLRSGTCSDTSKLSLGADSSIDTAGENETSSKSVKAFVVSILAWRARVLNLLAASTAKPLLKCIQRSKV